MFCRKLSNQPPIIFGASRRYANQCLIFKKGFQDFRTLDFFLHILVFCFMDLTYFLNKITDSEICLYNLSCQWLGWQVMGGPKFEMFGFGQVNLACRTSWDSAEQKSESGKGLFKFRRTVIILNTDSKACCSFPEWVSTDLTSAIYNLLCVAGRILIYRLAFRNTYVSMHTHWRIWHAGACIRDTEICSILMPPDA